MRGDVPDGTGAADEWMARIEGKAGSALAETQVRFNLQPYLVYAKCHYRGRKRGGKETDDDTGVKGCFSASGDPPLCGDSVAESRHRSR